MNTKLILTLALSLFCLFATAQKAKTKTLRIKTQIYCDHCLQCNTCGKRITNLIYNYNEGIKDIKINPKKNTITVVYDPDKAKPEKIKAAVNSAGYDADDKKAFGEGLSKLEKCCLKK